MTIKAMMASMRRKVEADIERNRKRRQAAFVDKKKRRISTHDLVARGLVKKVN
jgi:hypothetical protein